MLLRRKDMVTVNTNIDEGLRNIKYHNNYLHHNIITKEHPVTLTKYNLPSTNHIFHHKGKVIVM